jgi:prepilin-type N-terminal cleavage/methylation domain-containing protein
MRNNSGFSLHELMVVIGIFAIILSIGAPSFLKWRSEAKIKEAVSALRGDLEMAKLRAVRENEFVVVQFNANSYIIFIDDGAGGVGPGNWILDVGETRLRNRPMPAGVNIDLTKTTFTDFQTRFNGRGRIANTGYVTIVNSKGIQKKIDTNRFGLITVD